MRSNTKTVFEWGARILHSKAEGGKYISLVHTTTVQANVSELNSTHMNLSFLGRHNNMNFEVWKLHHHGDADR